MDIYILDSVGFDVSGGLSTPHWTLIDAMRQVPQYAGWKFDGDDTWTATKHKNYNGKWSKLGNFANTMTISKYVMEERK